MPSPDPPLTISPSRAAVARPLSGVFLPGSAASAGQIHIGEARVELHRVRDQADSSASLPPVVAAARALLPEKILHGEKYAIGRVVAAGGMGAILDAKDRTIRRTVAMKVMLTSGSTDDLARFVNEARITGQLEHPNIVPIHEIGIDEQDQPYYTMKFVKGVTLKSVLRKLTEGDANTIKEYPLRRLIVVLMRVCDAIGFANSKGVIHRDLKPENIMIGGFGEVLVMDWGLAKVLGRSEGEAGPREQPMLSLRGNACAHGSQTLAGSVMGTPHFMAPEQARGEVDKLDARTDAYSLGAVLYNILTLAPPVRGDSVEEVLENVCRHNIAAPTSFNSPPAKYPKGAIPLPHCPGRRIPNALSAIAMKALAAEPGDRYQTVIEMKADLDAYLGGFATRAEQASLLTQITLLIKRNKGVFATGFAAWFVITALLTWFVISVTASERRATTALHALRGTAPTFHAQAQALVGRHEFDEALEKITFATTLEPENGAYWRSKADIHQSLLQLPKAVEAYKKALERDPGDQLATRALELSRKLQGQLSADGAPPSAAIRELQDLMQAQGRTAEAMALAQRFGKGNEAAHEHWLRVVAEWLGMDADSLKKKWKPGMSHLAQFPDGTFAISAPYANKHHPAIWDLSPLKGMPLRVLVLPSDIPIADLTPLAGMPLERLHFGDNNRIKDLSPLRGMKLRRLYLGYATLRSVTKV